MSRSIGDINAKLAYITNRSTGPILKTKRPLLNNRPKFPKVKLHSDGCEKELDNLIECVNKQDDNDSCVQFFNALLKCNKTNQRILKQKEKMLQSGKPVGGKYDSNVARRIVQKYPERLEKRAMNVQRNLLNTLPEARIRDYPFKDKGRPFNDK